MKRQYAKMVLEDEIALLRASFSSTSRKPVLLDKFNTLHPYVIYKKAIVLTDGSRCGVLASLAYNKATSRKYVNGVEVCDVSNSTSNSSYSVNDNMVVYCFVDTERVQYSSLVLARLGELFHAATKHKNVRFVISLVVPEPQGVPNGVKGVAEREYDYILETKPAMVGPSRDYTIALHRACREAVRDNGLSVTVLRSVNIMGPEATGSFANEIRSVINEIFSSGKVSVSKKDFKRVICATLVTDVVAAAFWAVYNAVPGHEFNVISYKFAFSTLKRLIHESFSNELAYECICSAGGGQEFRCLSDLKFMGTKWRKCQNGRLDLLSAIKRIVCYEKNKRFAYAKSTAIYEGRLPQIKAVEMTILREIDRICKENGIKYFLAGGTLLGAVRNGASIPWDDDFDIGFLRRDFDRFRKACDKDLSDRFVHSCYYNGTNSHYMVDKIRMRDTYFSTRYSSIHAVEDGVFVDCLVYDATFKNKVFAKVHDRLCGFFGNLVQAHWREYRRDEVKSRLRWCLLKVVHLLPIGFYHRIYSWLIALHRKEKSPTHLIDSMGKHIGLGTIPYAGLDDVKRVPFDDGFLAPIPRDPTGYLIYDYGKGYLPLPPYCKQIAPHNFARIDLGKYLYGVESETSFRKVDLRGELFEKEVDCE